MIREQLKRVYTYLMCKRFKIPYCDFNAGMDLKIVNYRVGGVKIGSKTVIGSRSLLCSHTQQSVLEIGEKTLIGRDSTVTAIHSVVIEDEVLTGPHVFIADYNHEYNDPHVPIKYQGNRAKKEDRIHIERGTWIGTNAVIVGNVHIGRNCVIGANSVVTKDVPDYCVVAGAPAKIIRKYDEATNQWVRVL